MEEKERQEPAGTITKWMMEHCRQCSILQTQEKMERGELPIQTVAEDCGYRTISTERCSLCGEFVGNREEGDEPLFELTMNKVVKKKDPVTGHEETVAEVDEVVTLAILCGEACRDRFSEIVYENLQFPEVAVEEEEEPKEDWQS